MTKRLLSVLALGSLALPLPAQWFTPLSRDRDLGTQVVTEIFSKPDEYPIIPESAYPEAYRYIREMTNNLLNSGAVATAKEFQWEVYLINKDVKNAFCAPGGKIFVYTGLIRYLQAEHELAGVMGHEIAHADRRHTARQMEKLTGLTLLAKAGAAAAGGGSIANEGATLLTNVVGMGFSRAHEREADAMSVQYLCNTKYQADGAAAFFEKINQESGGQRQPAFLSTHPDPGNRIQNIRKRASQAKCAPKPALTDPYRAFIESLPKDYQ